MTHPDPGNDGGTGPGKTDSDFPDALPLTHGPG